MKKSAAALAAASLVGGLIALAPIPAQAATCDDPTHPIQGIGPSPEVTVGTTKKQTLKLIMVTAGGCQVTGASVIVESPRTLKKVTLHKVDQTPADGLTHWEGSTTIDPKSLRNSDAGDWDLIYRATGPDSQLAAGQAHVRRATRLSFNAGPEPVKNDKLTYSGTLTRANWDKRRYDGYRQQVTITYEAYNVDGPSQSPELVTTLTTAKNGSYTFTEHYRGPGDYNSDFAGTKTSAVARSPFDRLGA